MRTRKIGFGISIAVIVAVCVPISGCVAAPQLPNGFLDAPTGIAYRLAGEPKQHFYVTEVKVQEVDSGKILWQIGGHTARVTGVFKLDYGKCPKGMSEYAPALPLPIGKRVVLELKFCIGLWLVEAPTRGKLKAEFEVVDANSFKLLP